MTLQTVDHATHVLAGILTEALGKRRRPDLAQAEIDALSALRTLYDLQRKAWRRELAALKGRVARLSNEVAALRGAPQRAQRRHRACRGRREDAGRTRERGPVVTRPSQSAAGARAAIVRLDEKQGDPDYGRAVRLPPVRRRASRVRSCMHCDEWFSWDADECPQCGVA